MSREETKTKIEEHLNKGSEIERQRKAVVVSLGLAAIALKEGRISFESFSDILSTGCQSVRLNAIVDSMGELLSIAKEHPPSSVPEALAGLLMVQELANSRLKTESKRFVDFLDVLGAW